MVFFETETSPIRGRYAIDKRIYVCDGLNGKCSSSIQLSVVELSYEKSDKKELIIKLLLDDNKGKNTTHNNYIIRSNILQDTIPETTKHPCPTQNK